MGWGGGGGGAGGGGGGLGSSWRTRGNAQRLPRLLVVLYPVAHEEGALRGGHTVRGSTRWRGQQRQLAATRAAATSAAAVTGGAARRLGDGDTPRRPRRRPGDWRASPGSGERRPPIPISPPVPSRCPSRRGVSSPTPETHRVCPPFPFFYCRWYSLARRRTRRARWPCGPPGRRPPPRWGAPRLPSPQPHRIHSRVPRKSNPPAPRPPPLRDSFPLPH